MKAIILAGGFGTRLRRIVYDKPKSMAPIAGIPFLEHQIRLLKNQGITEFVILVSYMADKIKSYFGNGNSLGVNITYSEEEIPLGTAGAIKKAKDYIDDTFLVLSGDSYVKANLNEVLKFHKAHEGEFTMLLKKEYGPTDSLSALMEGTQINNFTEKKNPPALVNGGMYIFEPSILKYIDSEKNISLEKEILPLLAKIKKLNGYLYDGDIMNICFPETYGKFKESVLNSIFLDKRKTLREVIEKMNLSGIKFSLIIDENKKILGTITEREIIKFMINGGNLIESVEKIMNKNPIIASVGMKKEEILNLFGPDKDPIIILNELGAIKDIEFYEPEIEMISFPLVRGKAPLKISFAGGGTDLPEFFEEHGGSVINATIDKYCHATLVKRADNKIIINSDNEGEILVNSIDDLKYDGKLDLIKAVIKLMKPDFGLEFYIYNDFQGKGLGSSASTAVLVIKLLDCIMNTKYNDSKIVEIAYKSEREGLKRKGGWQDQYASVIGGINFMEFGEEKPLVYPLKLKEEVINELESHLLLCYIGNLKNSDIYKDLKQLDYSNEPEKINKLTRLKKLAYEIRDALLTNNLSTFGRLLNETWLIKRVIDEKASNNSIDNLYEIGIKNGAYGGRLLGTKEGGYMLFFHSPKARNRLTKALKEIGGEIMSFSFESEGVSVWDSKFKF